MVYTCDPYTKASRFVVAGKGVQSFAHAVGEITTRAPLFLPGPAGQFLRLLLLPFVPVFPDTSIWHVRDYTLEGHDTSTAHDGTRGKGTLESGPQGLL